MLDREKLNITDKQYNAIKAKIGSGEARLIEKESNSRYHYVVDFKGRELHVVFNRKSRVLVTVIPRSKL